MTTTPKGFGVRHTQTLLILLGEIGIFAIRTDLSVGIVAMTDDTGDSYFGTYNWDEPTKGVILSSFFWGYITTHIPAGLLVHRFNAKLVYFVTVFGSGVFTILVPLTAQFGWGYVCAWRIVIGLFHGFLMPCNYTLMSKWVHSSEYVLSIIIMTGSPFGIFAMMTASSGIITSSLGWPGIFYVSGGFAIAWSVVWFFFGCESPLRHKTISDEELKYLVDSSSAPKKENLPIPWRRMLTSVPLMAIVVANSTNNLGFNVLFTEIPSYYSKNLELDIQSSSLVSAIPYAGMGIISILMALLSDFLINRNYVSKTTARKTFNTIGLWVPMVGMIALGFITKDSVGAAIAVLVLSIGFNSGTNTGYSLNRMDLAPNFTGTVAGITNCIANIFSILAPIFVGNVVTDPADSSQWNIVFFVTAGFYFVGNLFFLFFGKATIQDWNEGKISRHEVRSA